MKEVAQILSNVIIPGNQELETVAKLLARLVLILPASQFRLLYRFGDGSESNSHYKTVMGTDRYVAQESRDANRKARADGAKGDIAATRAAIER